MSADIHQQKPLAADSPNAGYLSRSASQDSDDIDIRSLLLTLWRRRMIILGVMLLGLLVSYFAISFIQPRYTAKGLLLFEHSEDQQAVQDLIAMVSNLRIDTTLVLNEIEVLRSRKLAHKVVNKLNLISDPEFNPRLASTQPEGLQGLLSQFEEGSSARGVNTTPMAQGSSMVAARQSDVDLAVTIFLEDMRARAVPGSYVMQLEFTSNNAQKSASIVNTIIDTYIEMRLEEKFQATQKVSNWLDGRLTTLREQVRESERAVQDYREENDLTEGVRAEISSEQISQLASQLITAKAELAEATARFEQVDANRGNLDKIAASPVITDNPLIQQLKRDRIELQRELSDLSTRYGPKHPEILRMRSEIRDLRIALNAETKKVVEGLEGEVKVAQASVQALQQGFNEIAGRRHTENAAMIKLRELEREADSSRLIFDNFLETYKRSNKSEQLQDADVKVVSYATPPLRASYPNKMLLMSLAATISLFIGLAITFLLEKLDNTFRSAQQLENMGGYPCYALIPHVPKMNQRDLVSFIINKPSSTLAESVRTLRMVLNLRANDPQRQPRVVTVTSSFPGEGKTTLSTWLARLAAKSGEKVILIDCDLRRPNVHRALGKSNDRSLVDFLTDAEELEDVIHTGDPSGMHVIYGRSVPNSALDLVSSGRMKKLIASLRQVYDLVILDSPACLAVSDARVLATLSDQSLYAVSWDETPREVVVSGTKQFIDMHYKDMAFVLTNVDVKRHVKYGYGDTMYYYGRYKEYYTT